MPLRKRLGIVAGAAVAVAVVIAAVVCYTVVRGQLLGQVDSSLRAQAEAVQIQGQLALRGGDLAGLSANAGGPAPYARVVLADGTSYRYSGDLMLPVDAHARSIANGANAVYLTDINVGGSHLRELTFPVNVTPQFGGVSQPAAVQLARPLGGIDRVLAHLRLFLALLCAAGIAVAAALGRLAARRVLAPLAEVADTAVEIGRTDDLSRRLKIHADDEVGALATRFNQMLERLQHSRDQLDESVRAQRQLVADASHELRTPVTSLRTNIEVLLEGGQLGEEDRRRLLADVVEQSEELSGLVGDLIELARGDLPPGTTEAIRLDRVIEESLVRARRNYPHIRVSASLEPRVVEGAPDRLGRAINNLLDNAARHSPPDGLVEVLLDSDGLRVRDHGTGIDDEDLPHVFDRFYRGANSRGKQGSGLGLAIVRQVAEQLGGRVSAANAADGGAIFTLELPSEPVTDADDGDRNDDGELAARPMAPADAPRAPAARP
jgi:two-component system, OmpR family, sensor histidine kinase MprB